MLEPTILLLGAEYRELSGPAGSRSRVNTATVGQAKNLLILRHTEDLKALTVRDNVRYEAPVVSESNPEKVFPVVINFTIQAALPTTSADETLVRQGVVQGLNRLWAFYAGLHNSQDGIDPVWASAELYAALRRGEQ